MSNNVAVHRELFHLICADRIGIGLSREVFDSKILPNSVIKVEENAGRFQNVIEWETWQRVKTTHFGKWFCPCEHISACGSVLIMRKTTTPVIFPKRLPVFLGDHKRKNYGMVDGRFVCHDYGTNLLFENGMTKKMRGVEWWDE